MWKIADRSINQFNSYFETMVSPTQAENDLQMQSINQIALISKYGSNRVVIV